MVAGHDMIMERAVHEALMKMSGEDREEVARFMIDPAVLYILAATSRRSLSISEMSPIVNLPPATCYKMVYQMEKLGLVAYCGPGRNAGRGKASTYTSVLKEMRLDVKGSVIHLVVTWKNGSTDQFRRELTLMEPEIDRPVQAREVPVVSEDGRAASLD